MMEKEPSPGTLRKQPNSLLCFACGLENPVGLKIQFYDNGEDEVLADYVVPDHYQGYPDRVHGGILATILDELVGRAAMARDPNTFMASAKLTVRYRKPVPTGQPLKLSGKVLRRRGRIATSRAEIRLPDGTVGAEAEAMLVHLEGFDIESEELEELGWKVYPEDPKEDTRGGGDESA